MLQLLRRYRGSTTDGRGMKLRIITTVDRMGGQLCSARCLVRIRYAVLMPARRLGIGSTHRFGDAHHHEGQVLKAVERSEGGEAAEHGSCPL